MEVSCVIVAAVLRDSPDLLTEQLIDKRLELCRRSVRRLDAKLLRPGLVGQRAFALQDRFLGLTGGAICLGLSKLLAVSGEFLAFHGSKREVACRQKSREQHDEDAGCGETTGSAPFCTASTEATMTK